MGARLVPVLDMTPPNAQITASPLWDVPQVRGRGGFFSPLPLLPASSKETSQCVSLDTHIITKGGRHDRDHCILLWILQRQRSMATRFLMWASRDNLTSYVWAQSHAPDAWKPSIHQDTAGQFSPGRALARNKEHICTKIETYRWNNVQFPVDMRLTSHLQPFMPF